MKELFDIVEVARAHEMRGKSYVLATVVRTTGSTYRGPGTMMLISEDEAFVGSISGGCVEHDVLERAKETMTSGQTKLLTYDTTDEADILWGMGLGCSGIVDALLESSPQVDFDPFLDFLHHALTKQVMGIAVLVYRVEGKTSIVPGDRYLLSEDGAISTHIDDLEVRSYLNKVSLSRLEQLKAHPRIQMPGETLTYVSDTISVEAVVWPVVPPVDVTIFGAGLDAVPVIDFCKQLGWRVTVVDHRPLYAQARRIQMADEIQLGEYRDLVPELPLSPRSVVLLMTHHYLNDKSILEALADQSLAYLGVLGPVKRSRRLLDELERGGVSLLADREERLYSPVGLDIGGETPEAVALSIVAEIRAVLSERKGGPLRERKKAIHDRSGAS